MSASATQGGHKKQQQIQTFRNITSGSKLTVVFRMQTPSNIMYDQR